MSTHRALFALGCTLSVSAVGIASFAYVHDADPSAPPVPVVSMAEVIKRHEATLMRTAAPSVSGSAPAKFSDVTAGSGIRYHWTITGSRPLDILQTIGNGCAFFDYNSDGNLDVLLIGPKLALYQGDGHGHFTDVTHQTGLDAFHGHLLGCAVGDYDNDGYDDLYISGYRTGLLLHNEKAAGGGRRFRDVTRAAGLKPQSWGTSCAWADVDGDGHLDLFVGNYADFDPDTDQRLCGEKGKPYACGPLKYRSLFGVLYRNVNGREFQDVSEPWRAHGWGKVLGAAFADYNRSGRPSLYLADDECMGSLLQNQGGAFQEVGPASGTAFDGQGHVHGGMGTDWGDYDNDGRPDLFVATYQGETKCVYHNGGNGSFEERSNRLTLTSRTLPYVAFGAKWLDYDNDGWLDLMIANGHVDDNTNAIDPATIYRQPTQLFWNAHGRRFADVGAQAGSALLRPIVGRGLAVGDFDNDGRVDALVVDSEGTPLLLHNESPNVGHWLSFSLVGVHCNRDAYGAEVTVKAGGLTQVRVCHSDGSYLSSSDRRVHVGIGKANSAQRVSILWPDGHRDTFARVIGDREYIAREGAGGLVSGRKMRSAADH